MINQSASVKSGVTLNWKEISNSEGISCRCEAGVRELVFHEF